MNGRELQQAASAIDEAELERILARHGECEGPLLPILHDIQDAFGCIPDAAVPPIAEALNRSRAEIHGTISFYHDFRRVPPARPVLKLCRAEACQARGADRVAAALEGVATVEIAPVYCLGLCASGPAAMVGKAVFGRLDAEAALRLAESLA